MPDYDTVVIGAGNGGLTAALTLARNGLNVLLLERHNIPGGCATSFRRGRFEFEVALHQLSGMGTERFPGPLRSQLTELGVMDGLEFVRMENLYRVIVPDELDITLKADRTEITDTLKKEFPHEQASIEAFFNFLYQYCQEMVGAFYFRDPEASKTKYPLLCRYALKSSQSVLDEFFQDPFLQAVLGVYWSYMGLPPSKLAFNELATVLWAYIEFKPFHLKGGSQALSSALLDAFLRAGGKAIFNSEVVRIIHDGGRVSGVVTGNRDEISAKSIVSNAGTINTFVNLMDNNRPREDLKAVSSSTIGTSALTLYLGLDREPQDLGLQTATNFLLSSTDSEQAFQRARTMAPPEAMLLTCYNIDDPSSAPAGASQAALVGLQYAEPWLTVPPAQYFDTKYRLADGMLKQVESVFPQIRTHIEELEVATPLTHMRYLGHPGGAIYGQEQYAKDLSWFAKVKPGLQGLYFVGAWAASGGFQPTLGSGGSAARALLKDFGQL